MGTHTEVIGIGKGYGQIIFAGNVTVMLLFINNAIFRGAGDASIAMRSLWTANIVNFVLDPCFIFGLGPFPKWGVTGSAVATTIGRCAGIAYQLWLLFDGKGRIKIEWHQFHYESLSSTLRSTLWTIESLNAPVLCCSFSRKAYSDTTG